MTDKIEKPQKPAPSECCGGGSCCPCVWDRYFEELKVWKQQQGIDQASPSAQQKSDDNEDFFR